MANDGTKIIDRRKRNTKMTKKGMEYEKFMSAKSVKLAAARKLRIKLAPIRII